MHLLAATSGVIGDGGEAIDLAQDPADIIILSAADSELAALASAAGERAEGSPSLRLASLLLLRHDMSVDMWVERTAGKAKLIIARILGGRPYWPYGVEELTALAARGEPQLVLLPGGAEADEELTGLSTLPAEACENFRRLFAAGGPDNMARVLDYAAALLREGPEAKAPAPEPLPVAGTWLEGCMEPREARGSAAVIFYRALLEGGFTAPIEALCRALAGRGLAARPVFVTSLKDAAARAFVAEWMKDDTPDVIIDTTAFASGLALPDRPVIKAVMSGSTMEAWRDNPQGLSPRDLAMHVALPEVDGRIIGRAISFKQPGRFHDELQCPITSYEPQPRAVDFTAELAARHVLLRRLDNENKRLALVLANYPNRDSRIANGVGLDTPASVINILRALRERGYRVEGAPEDGNRLIEALAETRGEGKGECLSLDDYLNHFNRLPEAVRKRIQARWGAPEDDPALAGDAFHLPVLRLGNVVCAIQPARGYNIDPRGTYHDPALVPPHNYLAFYMWLENEFASHAVIHVGKHGNLEWLPGKALALSEECFPAAVFPPCPHFYPFIINDPGEGAQAKRRTHAVIIDHLMPPLARAEIHGPLAELERLVDEYWQASGMDRGRLDTLRRDIFELAHSSGVAADAGLRGEGEEDLARLDSWLCEIKEAQIRGGLHILGHLPGQSAAGDIDGQALAETLVALARLPRGDGKGENASLTAALAADLTAGFDPFEAEAAEAYHGPRPPLLAELARSPWRSNGDTRERLELLALKLARGMVDDAVSSFAPPGSCSSSATPGSPSSVKPGSSSSVMPGSSSSVMPGLDPGIQEGSLGKNAALDCRVKPGNDEEGGKAGMTADGNDEEGGQAGTTADGNDEEGEQAGTTADGNGGDPAGASPSLPHSAALSLPRAAPVLRFMRRTLLALLEQSARGEIANLMAGLEGRFVPPGPSGAPSRGQPDILPTGRNFHSLDMRAVPTPAAWRLGRKSAENMLLRHFHEHGEYPRAIGLSAWGTSNMRTGGDDIAQALALIGARPTWDGASGRVTGYEIITLAELGRPRVDVTLRISGFFRDAFPLQVELFDRAIRAIGALDEDQEDNPIAARMKREKARLMEDGLDEGAAGRMAGYRVFGAQPGAYGAGLQALFDENIWDDKADLAESWINWGAYAYGEKEQGTRAEKSLRRRLKHLDAVAHNQDNREHDLLDSDDYYQFEGGMAAAVEHERGRPAPVWHNDHSDPARPRTRSLEEEISRVMRARVANPKWIEAMMKHGYKGAFEIAASVDYMFAFAATTGAVKSRHFELVLDAFIRDERVRRWLADNNREALADITARLEEAMARGLWKPRANDAAMLLDANRRRV